MTTNSSLSRLVVVLLIASSTCAASITNAQESGRGDGIQWPSMDQGFLFVDGQYVPRPYEFRREGDAYFVNETNIATLGIDLSRYEEEAKARQERQGRKMRRGKARDPRDPMAKFHSDLHYALRASDTVLLVSGLPPVWYEDTKAGGDLLRVLVDKEKRADASTSVPDWRPVLPLKPTDKQRAAEHLSQWLAAFQPSSAFLADATAHLEVLNSAQAANDKASAATLRLATFGYPLTILMMILVVFAFGHLLSHRPNTDEWSDQLSAPFNRSLMLIGGLSAVDLVWTLLVSQAGAMHELNPIGSQMIGDPLQLVVFKVLVTAAAVGLLYFCRHVPLARQASWWSCLVLTLVAARWLVFNSMFIS